MRLAYRVWPLFAAVLFLPRCTFGGDGAGGDGEPAEVDGGAPAGSDAAPEPGADSGPDGGPAGPVRYVDLLFGNEDLIVVKDLLYAVVDDDYGTHRLLLDLYRPGPSDPVSERPVIVWVHGGNFKTGDRTQMAGYARQFARRGYVTVSIEYRLLKALDPSKGPQAAAEVAQEDVDAAMRYLTAHAGEHGIDPTRFIVGGFSAGSITSFQVGYRYEDAGHTAPTVIGVAALEGVLIGPSDFAAGDPPFILIRSDGGTGHHRGCEGDCEEIFTALLEAADALGIAHQMVKMPGAVHIDLISAELVPPISAIVAPFLQQQALAGAAE